MLDKKGHILSDSTYMKYSKRVNTELAKKFVRVFP